MCDDKTVDSIPDYQLVHRAIYGCRPSKWHPLWSRVSTQFALGSTFACQLCRKHGFNPHARSRRDMRLPPTTQPGVP